MAKGLVWRTVLIRVAIVVEGHTELDFVKRVLVDRLFRKGVAVQAHNLGGGVSINKIVKEMRQLCNSFQVVTSLVDYYGFKKKKDATVEQLQDQILEEANTIIPTASNCKIHLMYSSTNSRGCYFQA